ncbi:MAG: helix-turn-helix transcriptional regulator [Clostridia bacterium]|nr:helix-turn-helix transcriptional regulator [Clostridia bacterium]MBR2646108.1 helix-turn-helix transcriptional regulator [Clostridia bacterium]
MNVRQEYESLRLGNHPIQIKELINHTSNGRIHWHEAIEILYFTQGRAVTSCNLQSYSVKKGSIILVNGNELHTGIVSQFESRFYCFQFNPNFFHNLMGNDYIVFENIIEDEDCIKLLERLYLVSTGKSTPHNSLEQIRLTSELFLLLLERHTKTVLQEEEYRKTFKKLDTFNHIIEYLNEHYTENFSVGSLAAHFNMSPSYFAHFFKKNAQKSVIEYINEIRIMYAKLFLEKEDVSISEIALRTGFYDINYFSRKFKAITGMSPTEYKKTL